MRTRSGELKRIWAFTKTVRLKKFGRKRLVIIHEQEDLHDAPRFLLTDALHWQSGRVMETWFYRWTCEIFHEVCKQEAGLEAAQVRNQEAVNRHFRLSCIAQSILQRAHCSGKQSEKFRFAQQQPTIGQRPYTPQREALQQVIQTVQGWFDQGQSAEQVMHRLMPA